jgi:hypothetical protein
VMIWKRHAYTRSLSEICGSHGGLNDGVVFLGCDLVGSQVDNRRFGEADCLHLQG